jgi:hypothetical protein
VTSYAGLRAAFAAFTFLLPAAVLLFFSWCVWTANKRPVMAPWRALVFRWGLILASAAYALFLLVGYHLFRTPQPASGIWQFANWLGMALWVGGMSGAIYGRGSGRVLLLCASAVAFIGIAGISMSAMP